MPVTTATQDRDADARLPLLPGMSNRMGPAAFLQHLRLSTGDPSAALARYRLVDFMDDACPISSDGDMPTDQGTTSEEDETMEEEPQASGQGLPLSLPGPSACSYLSLGQSFIGSQRLSNAPARAAEDWQVVVRIQGLDLARGYVCGVMEAMNVPHSASPIITFWEGELVDNSNHTFLTQKWGATRDIDMRHWNKFAGFSDLESQVSRHAGKAPQLAAAPCIFMRWKETFFVNASEQCGLTIAGFYYVCLDRQTGTVLGYYFDPNSAPFQFLSLKPKACTGGGMSFGSYDLR